MRGRSAIALLTVVVGILSFTAQPAMAGELEYHGGTVVRNPHVYLTFWGSNWDQHPGARTSIQGMFAGLSNSGWQAILTQYYDTSGNISLNVGLSSWTDRSIAAPNFVNDQNLIKEVEYATVQ